MKAGWWSGERLIALAKVETLIAPFFRHRLSWQENHTGLIRSDCLMVAHENPPRQPSDHSAVGLKLQSRAATPSHAPITLRTL